jgi:Protein of unknown function (DUF4089)
MTDPDEFDPLAYVTAVAPALGIALTPDRVRDLAAAFALVRRIGAPALEYELPEHTELAPVFTP